MVRGRAPAKRAIRAVMAPGGTKVFQIKFRLPGYLRNLIEEAGERNGWGASEEIRRRLEHSFHEETTALDDETYRLLEAIKTVARNVDAPFGRWHGNRFGFDTFRAAVLALVDLHRPPGVPLRPADNEVADLYLGEEGTPETAGRMLAGAAAVAANIPTPGRRRRK